MKQKRRFVFALSVLGALAVFAIVHAKDSDESGPYQLIATISTQDSEMASTSVGSIRRRAGTIWRIEAIPLPRPQFPPTST